jgi:hypothetical protein
MHIATKGAAVPHQIRCLITHEPPAPELLNESKRTQAVRPSKRRTALVAFLRR